MVVFTKSRTVSGELFSVCSERPRPDPVPVPIRDDDPMLQAVNVERERVGSPRLVIERSLMDCSKAHSNQMARTGIFAHQGSGLPVLCDFGGENIYMAYPSASIQGAMVAWMKSPGHRQNILNRDFTRFGWGAVAGGRGVYFTQQFM